MKQSFLAFSKDFAEKYNSCPDSYSAGGQKVKDNLIASNINIASLLLKKN